MLLIFFFLSLLRASSTLKFGSPLHCSTLRWQQQITCNRCLSGQCVASSLRCISISLYLKISGGCSWASEPRWPGGQWPAARGNVQGAAVRRGAATSHHKGNQVIQVKFKFTRLCAIFIHCIVGPFPPWHREISIL